MNALWITLALLTAGFAGWPVTALVFRLARTIDDRTIDAAPHTTATTDAAADDAATTDDAATVRRPGEAGEAVSSARVLRGGAIIGVLERVAVFLAVLAGEPAAIAYVVAIKGLGRFAELKGTPVAAERFIIGTLTSLLWAAGVAVLARILIPG